MADLTLQVARLIRVHRLIPDGATVVVGVSGGVDSVVLLRALWKLAPARCWRLEVAHFNHRLRGRAADLDEQWVRKLALQLGLPFHAASADVRAHARQHRLSLEAAGRELRHRFLAGVARKTGAACVALAHNANDQTETFFLRLLRGTGGAGLAGMCVMAPSPADARITLVRPLLKTRRAEIEAFARDHCLEWREDASNQDEQPLRNWLRRRVLPLLETRTRGSLHRLVHRTADTVAADAANGRDTARAWLKSGRRQQFDSLPTAVQRYVITEQLATLGVVVKHEWIERLRLQADTPVTTPTGSIRRDAQGQLHRANRANRVFDTTELTLRLGARSGQADFGGMRVMWKRLSARNHPSLAPHLPGRELLDADRLGDRVTLRHWRPGDRFQPLGLSHPAKLQDLFTNAKLPPDQRRALVVATGANGEMFWVEGLRLGEAAKLRPETRHLIEWRWQRPHH